MNSMEIKLIKIVFELGEIERHDSCTWITLHALKSFDTESGEWVLDGEGLQGRGTSIMLAALVLIAERMGYTGWPYAERWISERTL
jgi:hypothetical protein